MHTLLFIVEEQEIYIVYDELDISALKNGMYILELHLGENMIRKVLVKSNLPE
jgi:hypothetical protein